MLGEGRVEGMLASETDQQDAGGGWAGKSGVGLKKEDEETKLGRMRGRLGFNGQTRQTAVINREERGWEWLLAWPLQPLSA